MKQLTDAQYMDIWAEAHRTYNLVSGGHVSSSSAAGRAAYEAAYPLVIADALAEPTAGEWVDASLEVGHSEAMQAKDGKVFLSWTAVRELLANRRKRLTAKPDAAVEAVKAALRGYGTSATSTRDHEMLAAIVAAVRAADKAGKP